MQVERFRLPSAPARVRVFAASDLHVTLGFLGQVQESDARRAWDLVEGFEGLQAVHGTFSRVIPLGNPRKPSALSAMVEAGREPLGEMIAAARGPVLAAAGAPEDLRPPLPHMTVARIQRRANAAERRQALRWAETIDLHGASFAATSVALFTWSEDRETRLFRIVEQRELPH